MANIEHYCFQQPENNLRLWRYMDFTKFVSLIETKKLYFCRSDLFNDQFEGSYTKATLALREVNFKGIIDEDKRDSMLSKISAMSKWVREWTYLNCWHANEYESAALWRLYSQTNESVAVETDYQTLSKTLPEEVYLGLVQYVNY